MNKTEIIEKVNQALADEFEVEVSVITPEADIKETLDLDSLSLVDMVALVENVTGVEIKGTDVASIKTFAALYDFIEEKMK
jgi:acyl carrier protein